MQQMKNLYSEFKDYFLHCLMKVWHICDFYYLDNMLYSAVNPDLNNMCRKERKFQAAGSAVF